MLNITIRLWALYVVMQICFLLEGVERKHDLEVSVLILSFS